MSAAAILTDVSGSMVTSEGNRTRHGLVWPDFPGARVIPFSALPQELPGLEPGANPQLPPPAGSRGFAPTDNQAAWLSRIVRRCGVPGWDPLS
jgi:hypothetical protein